MTVSESEIRRLQKLSCIALTPEEEKKLWKQLNDIIGFLGQLPETKVKSEEWRVKSEGKLTLRTIAGIKESSDNKKIMENVKHPVINNSIVIKSVLN
jgi:aspartyl/glutamyl-tRNA(Asn/Gln) amidotransferase C subunit